MSKSSDLDTPEVNLTPLIDVVFVVLISFILIAPLLKIEQIDLAGSGDRAKSISSRNQEQLKIGLRADDSLYLGSQKVTDQQLLEQLKHLKKRSIYKECPLILCDRRASFGAYQSVRIALEGAGFERAQLVLTPMDQRG